MQGCNAPIVRQLRHAAALPTLSILMAQVITEPGAEAALDAQWADKLVFVDGMDQIVQQIEVYTTNRTLREQKLTAAISHAKAHYSLELYLQDFLKHQQVLQQVQKKKSEP